MVIRVAPIDVGSIYVNVMRSSYVYVLYLYQYSNFASPFHVAHGV